MRTSFAILDQTKTFSVDKLSQLAHSCEVQLNRDLAPRWGGDYAVRVGAPDSSDLVTGEVAVAIMATMPPNTPSNAIAFHDVTGEGVPFIIVSLLMVGSGPLSVSVSHELCEEAVDPGCNFWADNFQGKEFALEACDATESDTYDCEGLPVSNFVLPEFFRVGAPGPFTHLGASTGTDPVRAPFQTAPGGYQEVRTATNGPVQVNGMWWPGVHQHDREYHKDYDPKRKAMKEERRGHYVSRGHRRMRGVNSVLVRHDP
jgi:hypothetical protein